MSSSSLAIPSAHLTGASTSRHYLTNIQILRFFAALLVVCGHSEYEMLMMAGRSVEDGLRLIDWGLGVDIFFVISGFLMYYLMHDKFGAAGAARGFIKRRLIRIVPLYWIFTTLLLVLISFSRDAVTHNSIEPAHVVASYLFFPYPRADGELFPLLSLGWTLNYEMFFYAVFTIALVFRKSIGLVLLLGSFLVLAISAQAAPTTWWLLKFWGSPLIGEFALGLGLAAIFIAGVRIKTPLFLLMVLAGIVLAMIFFQTRTYETVTRLVTGGLPAILITSAAVLLERNSHGTISRWLAIGGDASYALYLSHAFSINVVRAVWLRLGLAPDGTLILIAIATSIVGSLVVFHYVESPLLKGLQHIFDRRRRAEAI